MRQDQPGVDASDLPLIAPTHHLAFPSPRDGQSVVFHPDEQTAWVHSWDVTIDVWPAIVDYGAYPTGVLTAILLPILLWRAWRLWRLPQRRGRTYCRNCNYDVTEQLAQLEVDSSDAARCSECGEFCTTGRIVPGRTFFRRTGKLLVTTGVAAVLFGVFDLMGGPFQSQVVDWFSWPSPWLYQVATDNQWAWLLRHQAYGDLITKLDLESGQDQGVIYRDCAATPSLCAGSLDGSAVFLVGRHGILRVDTRTGRVTPRDPSFPGLRPSTDAPLVHYEDPKSGDVYYSGLDVEHDRNVLVRWNPDSGAIGEAFSMPIIKPYAGLEVIANAPAMYPLSGSGSARWVAVAGGAVAQHRSEGAIRIYDAQGTQLTWRSTIDEGVGVADVADSSGELHSLVYQVSSQSDGIEFLDTSDLSVLDTLRIPDRSEATVPSAISASSGGLICVGVMEVDSDQSSNQVKHVIWVCDARSRTWVARLDCQGAVIVDHVTVSPHGRWIAAQCRGSRAAGVRSVSTDLLIWDLSSLHPDTRP